MATAQTRRPRPRPRTSARRTATPARRGAAGGWIQRRRPQPEQSGLKRLVGGATGALAGITGRKAAPTRSHGKAKAGGGLAFVTAAAGLAFKYRDKLLAKAKGKQQDSAAPIDMSQAQPGVAHEEPFTPPRP